MRSIAVSLLAYGLTVNGHAIMQVSQPFFRKRFSSSYINAENLDQWSRAKLA
jgi:hypothetical protein